MPKEVLFTFNDNHRDNYPLAIEPDAHNGALEHHRISTRSHAADPKVDTQSHLAKTHLKPWQKLLSSCIVFARKVVSAKKIFENNPSTSAQELKRQPRQIATRAEEQAIRVICHTKSVKHDEQATLMNLFRAKALTLLRGKLDKSSALKAVHNAAIAIYAESPTELTLKQTILLPTRQSVIITAAYSKYGDGSWRIPEEYQVDTIPCERQ